MKYLFLIVNTFICILLIMMFNSRIPMGKSHLPPVGKLLNPFTGVWQNAEDHNFSDFEIRSKALSEEVKVVFDKRMVPHIYAQNLADLFFAQGYIEAYLRLWQMDITYRSASGCLSEVVGNGALQHDKRMRKLGLNHSAQKSVETWKMLESYDKKIAESFVSGVNHFINQLQPKDYPAEYKIIDYQPTPWSLYKSALVQKSMANVLASHADDISNTNAKLHFGSETFNYLFPERDPDQLPIIPRYIGQVDPLLSRDQPSGVHYSQGLLKDLHVNRPKKGLGSNNWAVGPTKTASGSPILANDPHLNLTIPSVWYEVHLNAPGYNAYGVSIAGIPGIIIGFNDQISWGLTNVGHDVKDYYAIEWMDEEKTKYLLDGEEQLVEIREEVIKVRNGKDIVLPIKETYFGPIYYESTNDSVPDLAMDWLVNRTPTSAELNSFIDIPKCQNYEEFKLASAQFEVPAQNFLFADKAGNIALRINGKLPLKYQGEGRWVKTASSKTNKWNEFIPRSSNPQIENPEQGYVGSANQVSATDDYPYYFTGGFEDFRGKRVYQELDRLNGITSKDMIELQADNYSLKAEEILPFLITAINDQEKDNYSTKVYESLKSWDYRYDRDASAPGYFEVFYKTFEELYWDEFEEDFTMYKPDTWRFHDLVLNQQNEPFADLVETEEIENASDIASLAFAQSCEKLKEDDKLSKWSSFRPTKINHLANIPGFGTGTLEVGGHGDVLNAINRGGFGPSWRMIVDLQKDGKALGIFPGGQSGNPGSKFYKNNIQKWVDMEYNELHLYQNSNEMGNDIMFTVNMDSNEK